MSASTKQKCSSCGWQHVLFLRMADATDPLKSYQFTCPRSGHDVAMQGGNSWRIVQTKPPGAVILREGIAAA